MHQHKLKNNIPLLLLFKTIFLEKLMAWMLKWWKWLWHGAHWWTTAWEDSMWRNTQFWRPEAVKLKLIWRLAWSNQRNFQTQSLLGSYNGIDILTIDYFGVGSQKQEKYLKNARQNANFKRYKSTMSESQATIWTNPWFSGGVEPKKNPIELLGGLSDIPEFRPVPWFLRLLEKNRCLWDDCCFWKFLCCFFRELALPDSSWPMFPAEFSPVFKFDSPEALLENLGFPSLFS